MRSPSDTVRVLPLPGGARFASVSSASEGTSARLTWIFRRVDLRGDTVVLTQPDGPGPLLWRYVLTDAGDSLRPFWTTTPPPAFGRIAR